MPTTEFRNLIYRAALPVMAPSPRGKLKHVLQGHPISLPAYERILCKHHVFGSTLLLASGEEHGLVHTSIQGTTHQADSASLYRVASITKMATALVVLRLMEDGAFQLDDPVASHLPDAERLAALKDVTIRQLLSHTSGLQDTPAYDRALSGGMSFHEVLRQENIRVCSPGTAMHYCNFGFGLLGCMLEHVSGMALDTLFRQQLFVPLGMEAALDATTLDENRIMPITRILPYRKGTEVTITPLGRKPLNTPDPHRHFGHTAGAMYTNAPSLSAMLTLIAQDGSFGSRQLLQPASILEMKKQHSHAGPASSPTRRYGLGLVILQRPDLSSHTLYGHQGFAYGCVDGAFFEADTARQLVFLNGGCSEAREGRLGLCNKDLLIWALQKELPTWT